MMLGEGQVHRPSGKGVRGAYNALRVGAKKARERVLSVPESSSHKSKKSSNYAAV
ncbi:hypothetical protein [Parageobacillus thermoglucosidasius]|uniref:hypothetical protein n=1 Tax=Parageobacillus thermoglucosidasius TaxID=1426 RepID=UPI000B200696|nr:hypothetical protein [Parageobacillus thermoglucosidasius]